MKPKFTLFLLALAMLSNSYATHIVGGTLTYEHLGGSSYSITLRLYKDCRAQYFDSTTMTWVVPVNFPNDANIEVRLGDGTLPGCYDDVLDFSMPRIGRDTLTPALDTCAFDPGICVEEAVFTAIVSLPPRPEGYHLFYRTWARNYTLNNIVSTNDNGASTDAAGETFNTFIPNTALLSTNSSPVFTNFPPVYVCASQDLNFDNSATDLDGDSLVYSLYHPYTGRPDGQANDCQLTFGVYDFFPSIINNGMAPENIDYPNVFYLPGYSEVNPINGSAFPNDTLWFSPGGILHGIPRVVGQYVVGVKVEEYRDGVKIGEIVRDFQFNVVVCPSSMTAGITPVIACGGTNVQFINDSGPAADGFWWDFGTGNPADTSLLENPTFNYSTIGDYTVTLIAQKGTHCADTAQIIVPVVGLPEVTLTSITGSDDQAICIGTAIEDVTHEVVYTNDVTGTNLPSGLTDTLIGNEHTISGLPTETGVFNYTITASGACLPNATISGTILIYDVVDEIDTRTECAPFSWIDGVEYNSSNNTATFIYPNASTQGCDSIISLDLTISSIDLNLTQTGATLSANQANADSYQWIDCFDNSSIIGETNQTFTPNTTGSYAVILDINGCSGTSVCQIVDFTSIVDQEFNTLKFYPNSTDGLLFVDGLGSISDFEYLILSSINGQELLKLTERNNEIDLSNFDSGIYFIKVVSKRHNEVFRIVKR